MTGVQTCALPISDPVVGQSVLLEVVRADLLAAPATAHLRATRITENVSVAESPAKGRDIFSHAPESRGARDYDALLDELLSSGFWDVSGVTASGAGPADAQAAPIRASI